MCDAVCACLWIERDGDDGNNLISLSLFDEKLSIVTYLIGES